MIMLEKNEKYMIESLDDLINCPVNMMSDAIKQIAELHLKRIELIQERGTGIDFKNVFIELINDGVDETKMEITEKSPQLTTNKSTDNIKPMGEL